MRQAMGVVVPNNDRLPLYFLVFSTLLPAPVGLPASRASTHASQLQPGSSRASAAPIRAPDSPNRSLKSQKWSRHAIAAPRGGPRCRCCARLCARLPETSPGRQPPPPLARNAGSRPPRKLGVGPCQGRPPLHCSNHAYGPVLLKQPTSVRCLAGGGFGTSSAGGR